jgi:hypothetical protein
VSVRPFDRAREEIAAFRHGLDDLLILVVEGAPHLGDAMRERFLGYGDIGPHCGEQFLLAQKASGVLGEGAQEFEALRAQADLGFVAPETAARQVQNEALEREVRGGPVAHVRPPNLPRRPLHRFQHNFRRFAPFCQDA